MTSTVDPRELAPLRAALLATARARAQAEVAKATADSDALVNTALEDAKARVAAARARGTNEAVRAVATEETAARLQARTLVLQARESVDNELRRQVRARVLALRQDAAYESLRAALRRHGRALLGDAAIYHEPPAGGVVVEAPGRRVDASLDTLAGWAAETEAEGFTKTPTRRASRTST